MKKTYSMDNDDQNYEHKHYTLNNVKHVVNDTFDMYNNTVMYMTYLLQRLLSVLVSMENNYPL